MLTYGRFTFRHTKDEFLIRETYRLRYEVYVQEFGFEDKNDHVEGSETDDFEKYSEYFVCQDEEKNVVGAIRLVLNSPLGFPIEQAADVSVLSRKPVPEKTAEISRLAITKKFRRRKEDGQHGVESYLMKKDGGVREDDGTITEEQRKRERPIIVLGLYQAMYHYSKRNGILYWYMITEQKLSKALAMYGIKFEQFGEPVYYHGWRIPYYGSVEDIERKMHEDQPDMYQLMLYGLEKELYPDFIAH